MDQGDEIGEYFLTLESKLVMRTSFVIATFILVLLASCLDERDVAKQCADITKPLEEILALKSIVKNGVVIGRKQCTIYAGAQIFSGMYKGGKVFYFTNPASSLAICGFIAYNCQGEEVFNRALNDQEWEDFMGELTDIEQLWVKNP
ncbi:MAG: hypothetical protein KF687_03445 [Cyclobacteriaceae bacterium]|nr:hypothetical protein [Cyclobacteriaceae bacterium]